MPTTLLVCNCLESQPVDRERISSGTAIACSRIHTSLCMTGDNEVAEALLQGDLMIACGQETAHFEQLAADIGADQPIMVDIRDRAGWSDEAESAGPKQAALVADALLPTVPVRAVDVVSEGRCLIVGTPETALAAAKQLAELLSVTVLTEAPPELPDIDRRFDVVSGRLVHARGAFGRFQVRIDGLRQLEPAGRGEFGFSAPRDGAESGCDLILDLSGGTPLFPAHTAREGYLRADPGDPKMVAARIFEAGQSIGTFEKPLYVRLDESLCAHARAGQTGCSNCLDICPTGAITPDGDHVAVDSMVCAGCGSCSAVCPSGAISYDAPSPADVFRRIETLARTFRNAGGSCPSLLVVDDRFGPELISYSARFGRGLPADVIPMEISALASFGHAEMLAALACGFVRVDVLLSPRTERAALETEAALATAMGAGDRVTVLDIRDPDVLSESLYARPSTTPVCTPILPMGSRRQVARLAAKAMHQGQDPVLPLPGNSPYGAIGIDQQSCTLCLACASLCPSGALGDNPDTPQLRFQEDACLQCGVCRQICPENAITLIPQIDLSDTAFSERVLNEEPPFNCIECGKPFGVKSAIERIASRLEGRHSMFSDNAAARLIRMCDDCRVRAQMHSTNNPFAGSPRPRVRTTEDYLDDGSDH